MIGIDTSAPLVSIVLPTYNGARYIDEAIQSCLGQTYRTLELIVVDDGSSDDTVAKVRKYLGKDRRVRLIHHERNRRLPAALNTGFAHAAGQYLTWTSDDNLYRPEALGEMVAFLDRHPDVGMVYTDYSLIDESGDVIQPMAVGESERLLMQADVDCIGACFLYRRRVQDVVGNYAEDLFLAEDYDYFLRVSDSFLLRPYHKDLYCYRIHRGSLTARYNPGLLPLVEKVLARHLRVARVPASTKATLFFMCAQRAWGRGEIFRLLGYLVRAGVYSPRVFAQCLMRAVYRRVGHQGYAR